MQEIDLNYLDKGVELQLFALERQRHGVAVTGERPLALHDSVPYLWTGEWVRRGRADPRTHHLAGEAGDRDRIARIDGRNRPRDGLAVLAHGIQLALSFLPRTQILVRVHQVYRTHQRSGGDGADYIHRDQDVDPIQLKIFPSSVRQVRL